VDDSTASLIALSRGVGPVRVADHVWHSPSAAAATAAAAAAVALNAGATTPSDAASEWVSDNSYALSPPSMPVPTASTPPRGDDALSHRIAALRQQLASLDARIDVQQRWRPPPVAVLLPPTPPPILPQTTTTAAADTLPALPPVPQAAVPLSQRFAAAVAPLPPPPPAALQATRASVEVAVARSRSRFLATLQRGVRRWLQRTAGERAAAVARAAAAAAVEAVAATKVQSVARRWRARRWLAAARAAAQADARAAAVADAIAMNELRAAMAARCKRTEAAREAEAAERKRAAREAEAAERKRLGGRSRSPVNGTAMSALGAVLAAPASAVAAPSRGPAAAPTMHRAMSVASTMAAITRGDGGITERLPPFRIAAPRAAVLAAAAAAAAAAAPIHTAGGSGLSSGVSSRYSTPTEFVLEAVPEGSVRVHAKAAAAGIDEPVVYRLPRDAGGAPIQLTAEGLCIASGPSLQSGDALVMPSGVIRTVPPPPPQSARKPASPPPRSLSRSRSRTPVEAPHPHVVTVTLTPAAAPAAAARPTSPAAGVVGDGSHSSSYHALAVITTAPPSDLIPPPSHRPRTPASPASSASSATLSTGGVRPATSALIAAAAAAASSPRGTPPARSPTAAPAPVYFVDGHVSAFEAGGRSRLGSGADAAAVGAFASPAGAAPPPLSRAASPRTSIGTELDAFLSALAEDGEAHAPLPNLVTPPLHTWLSPAAPLTAPAAPAAVDARHNANDDSDAAPLSFVARLQQSVAAASARTAADRQVLAAAAAAAAPPPPPPVVAPTPATTVPAEPIRTARSKSPTTTTTRAPPPPPAAAPALGVAQRLPAGMAATSGGSASKPSLHVHTYTTSAPPAAAAAAPAAHPAELDSIVAALAATAAAAELTRAADAVGATHPIFGPLQTSPRRQPALSAITEDGHSVESEDAVGISTRRSSS